jgi:hypothetical protein
MYKYFSVVIVCTMMHTMVLCQGPRILEFGWDYPTVTKLKQNLNNMQSTPFNGIGFSIKQDVFDAFDTAALSDDYFQYDDLKKLKWGKYTDNYIMLRGYGSTGGCWFDDVAWKNITNNISKLSKAVSYSGAKGIIFDPEYYLENKLYNPWTYNKQQYPDKSFAEVQNQVKKRGIEFINALQKNKADISLLSIWITGLIREEMKIMPLDKTLQALLLSFMEGIFEGKNKTVKITDGNEIAYGYTNPSQFMNSKTEIREQTITLMQSPKARDAVKKLEISQPIFYDGILALAPRFDKGFSTKTKWQWLEENIKYAMAGSDNIIWFYSERINCWNNKNTNDTLFSILQNIKTSLTNSAAAKNNVKEKFAKTTLSCKNINEEKGYYYSASEKTPMKTGECAFSFNWNTQNKLLIINFYNKPPETISVFTNNDLAAKMKCNTSSIKIKLRSFKKGKIIVNALYDDKMEASGIQIY